MTGGGRLAGTQAAVHKHGVLPRLQAPPLGLGALLDLVAQLLRACVYLFSTGTVEREAARGHGGGRQKCRRLLCIRISGRHRKNVNTKERDKKLFSVAVCLKRTRQHR